MRILLVEDDQKHREDLQRSLGHAKASCPRCVMPVTLEVETAESIEEARKMIVGRGYEFILLDIDMKGSVGVDQLIHVIRKLTLPFAYYTTEPKEIPDDEAPVWENPGHVRMDLVSKISDYYQKFVIKHKKTITESGRFSREELLNKT